MLPYIIRSTSWIEKRCSLLLEETFVSPLFPFRDFQSAFIIGLGRFVRSRSRTIWRTTIDSGLRKNHFFSAISDFRFLNLGKGAPENRFSDNRIKAWNMPFTFRQMRNATIRLKFFRRISTMKVSLLNKVESGFCDTQTKSSKRRRGFEIFGVAMSGNLGAKGPFIFGSNTFLTPKTVFRKHWGGTAWSGVISCTWFRDMPPFSGQLHCRGWVVTLKPGYYISVCKMIANIA